MADAVAQQLRCPACAAPVEAPPGDVLHCPYCGSKSRIGRTAATRAPDDDAPRRASMGAPVLTMALVVFGMGVSAYFLLVRGGSESVSSSSAAASRPVMSAPAQPTPVLEAVPSPAPEPAAAPEPERPTMDDMFSSKPAAGAIEVHWTAKVKKADGRSKRGVKCDIVGFVEDDGDSVRPLDVTCKGDLLYSSTQKFSGMANMSTGATVVTAKDGSPHWVLRYDDTGSRELRAQIRIDSAARIGRIWSDELPPWDVELAVDPEGKPVKAR